MGTVLGGFQSPGGQIWGFPKRRQEELASAEEICCAEEIAGAMALASVGIRI